MLPWLHKTCWEESPIFLILWKAVYVFRISSSLRLEEFANEAIRASSFLSGKFSSSTAYLTDVKIFNFLFLLGQFK